ncbi:MAG: hypothetical protein L3J39_08360 [Verrucomicrobiales bacterium]|nr:hypothetical protein [Verrucomicrobiales bacterium]
MKASPSVKIKTIEQAYDYVLEVTTCLIFGSEKSDLPSLWDAVDLPEQPPAGQKGWGEKVEAIWVWKNELPAHFPDEIFYGKLPGGLAMLMCLDYLQQTHYPAHHRPVSTCKPLARELFSLIRTEPHTSAELRRAISPDGDISKSRINTAIVELQTTLNIVRSNAPEIKRDTWLPFGDQYLLPEEEED